MSRLPRRQAYARLVVLMVDSYRKACRLVAYAENQIPDDEPAQAAVVARAQVYATLALAAATAANIRRNGAVNRANVDVDPAAGWPEVLG